MAEGGFPRDASLVMEPIRVAKSTGEEKCLKPLRHAGQPCQINVQCTFCRACRSIRGKRRVVTLEHGARWKRDTMIVENLSGQHRADRYFTAHIRDIAPFKNAKKSLPVVSFTPSSDQYW